jgi:hypothetical protein
LGSLSGSSHWKRRGPCIFPEEGTANPKKVSVPPGTSAGKDLAFFAFNRSQEAHVTLGVTTEFLLYDPNVEYQAGKAVVDSLACDNGNDADERDVTLVQVRGFFGSPTSGPRRWWRLARGDRAWIFLVSPPLHEKPRVNPRLRLDDGRVGFCTEGQRTERSTRRQRRTRRSGRRVPRWSSPSPRRQCLGRTVRKSSQYIGGRIVRDEPRRGIGAKRTGARNKRSSPAPEQRVVK